MLDMGEQPERTAAQNMRSMMSSRHYGQFVSFICQILRVFTAFVVFAGFILTPAQAAPNHIAAELLAGPQAGTTVTLAIRMKPEPNWHGYWFNPGDAGLGMQLDWELPEGAKTGTPTYPVPHPLIVQGLMNHVYGTEYAVLIPLTLPQSSFASGTTRIPIRVKAQWLACSDTTCVPERAELATEVIAGAPDDPKLIQRFDAWTQKLPAQLDTKASFAITDKAVRIAIPLPQSVPLASPHLFIAQDKLVDYAAPQSFARKGDVLIISIPRAKLAMPNPNVVDAVLRLDDFGNGIALSADPGTVPTGGEPIVTHDTPRLPALPWLLLAAFAGGVLLNIMPCVFPVLSLKALSLARAGESQSHARNEGLAYTAGVTLACLALGGLLLILRAVGQQVGWAFQLQEPAVVVGLFVLALAITANLLGLFEFAVPGFANGATTQSAFATGLLAAFVATPCTGPFMASAMGAALLLPVPAALSLFAVLGLGIAAPFLAIALIPALRHRLPRPGGWMVTFRRVMAIPMGVTALALAWLMWRLGGAQTLGYVVALGIVVLAFLSLTGRAQKAGRSALIPALLALGLCVGGIASMPEPQLREDGPASILDTKPFSHAALRKALATGRPVFVWMTADWCLTCKVNEEVAIEREDTKAAFDKAGVIVLRGDWTRRDPEITRYLTAQGAAGVPLYIWYNAQGQAQTLPQVLTPSLLQEQAAR